MPAIPSAVFTENGQRLELGDGLWHTVTGRGGYALRLADVERGQTVLMGTIREAGVPTILVVRLKVARRRIEEIETLVIRNEAAAKSFKRVTSSSPAIATFTISSASLMKRSCRKTPTRASLGQMI